MGKGNAALSGAASGAAVGTQVMPGWGTAIGAGIGMLAGGMMGQDDKSGEQLARLTAMANEIPLPVLKEYYPELYQQVVQLNPELETAVNLGPSEMQGIATDPVLRQAQLKALASLQGIGEAGGRDAQFLAEQGRLESDINQNLQGQQGAVLQNMAARGMSGSGLELVAQNQNIQGAANRQAQMEMDLKAQAQQRALQAIMQGGQLGGQMQAQDFGQAAAKAQAADAIARFNAQNQQNVIGQNVAAKNQAQAWNAQTAQNVANQNVGTRNQATQYNLSIPQMQYQNQLNKLAAVSGAGMAEANNMARQAAEQNQFAGNLISAGAQAYGAYQKQPNNPEPRYSYQPAQSSGNSYFGDQFRFKNYGEN